MNVASPDHPDALRVLIVRPTALGDVARTVPALVTLRQALPHATIDWLVARAYVDLLRHHPALHTTIPFDRKRLGQMWWNPAAARDAWRWACRLRQANYNLVVDLQGLLRSGICTRLTGAGRRIGFANAREGAAFAYTEKHALDPQRHTVDRMLGLLEAAGFQASHDMRLYAGREDLQWARDYLGRHGDADAPFACIAPTAQWRCKCWPLSHYEAVARRLLQDDRAGRRVIVLAAAHERPYLQPLLDNLADQPGLLMPELTVGRMMALLSLTAMLVCNDSGPLHVAVGFDRPIVAIYGPTDPAVVGPYQRMDAVVSPGPVDLATQRYYRRHRQDQSLISQVDVEAVWSHVETQWQAH